MDIFNLFLSFWQDLPPGRPIRERIQPTCPDIRATVCSPIPCWHTLLAGLNNKKEVVKNNDGAVSLGELGGYSKQATADISKEIGHSQTPLIINFGKDQPVYKLRNAR
ncbi:MAG: hypothetical protein Q8O11_04720 [Syntrophales bacterium]|nr:hypothetical protein [Syntrophales bacterium]